MQIIFDIIGILGSTILVCSLFPQIIRIYHRKHASDLSYIWLLVSMIGQICLIIYGLYFQILIIWIPLSIQLISFTTMLLLKINYEKNNTQYITRSQV